MSNTPWRNTKRFGVGLGAVILAAVLIPFDQGLNALRGGDPDQTISYDCGQQLLREDAGGEEASHFCDVVCFVCDRFDANHCREAME